MLVIHIPDVNIETKVNMLVIHIPDVIIETKVNMLVIHIPDVIIKVITRLSNPRHIYALLIDVQVEMFYPSLRLIICIYILRQFSPLITFIYIKNDFH